MTNSTPLERIAAFSLFCITLVILASLTILAYEKKDKDLLSQTRAVCTLAYSEMNGDSEERCGQLQDQTNTEWICNKQGNCWLEVL